jgi:hypothetical protein
VAEVSYLMFGDCCRIAAEALGTTPEQIAMRPEELEPKGHVGRYSLQ